MIFCFYLYLALCSRIGKAVSVAHQPLYFSYQFFECSYFLIILDDAGFVSNDFFVFSCNAWVFGTFRQHSNGDVCLPSFTKLVC